MFRFFLHACLFAFLLGITGCGDRTPIPAGPVSVVEQAPEPTCAPASDTPPEPDLSGDTDGDGVNETRPAPDEC